MITEECLRLGDCLEVMKDLKDDFIDMVLVDLPYGVINRPSNGLRNFDKGKADVETFEIEDVLNLSLKKCKGSFYVFCSTEQVSEIRKFFVDKKMSTRLCIWEKSNPSPANGQHLWLSGVECFVYAKKPKATFNEHCKNTVFKHPVPRGKFHPTQKPIKLLERLIKASSNQDDWVLDFVMGSGSTGVACKNTNRNFVGIEQDEKYFEIAKQRILS